MNWGHSSKSVEILKLQCRCVQVMSGISYLDCFLKLNLLTFPSLYILTCLTCIKNHTILFQRHGERSGVTRNKTRINLIFHRIDRSKRCNDYYEVKFFNKIPENNRILDEKLIIKTLKEFLMRKAFYEFEEYLNFDFNLL